MQNISSRWLSVTLLIGTAFVVGALFLILAARQAGANIPPNGYIVEAHFKHDTKAGTATSTDSSGNNHDGAILGDVATTTGKYGSAFKFDGSGDYVSIPDKPFLRPGTGDFTIAAWIKASSTPPSSNTYLGIVTKGTDAGSYNFYVDKATGKLKFKEDRNNIPNISITGAANFLDNAWHHVAAVRRSGTVYLYEDGVERASTTAFSGFDFTNTEPVLIGYRGTGQYYFDGPIDDVRIYSAGLNSAEIATVMNNEYLTAHWKHDDNANATSTDSSGNSHNGSLLNGAAWTSSGKYGNAISFDGTNDYVSVPDNSQLRFGTGPFTIAAWISADDDSDTNYRGIVIKGTSTGSYYFYLDTATGKLKFKENNTNQSMTGDINLADGTWHHVAVVRDNVGTVRLYRDGEVVSTNTTDFVGLDFNSASPVFIGYRGTSAYYFKGLIDDVRIYATSTEQFEIENIMEDNASPRPPDTTAPSAPTLTATVASSTQINLSWSGAYDAESGIDIYELERCIGSACTDWKQIASLTGTSYMNLWRTPSTTYRYRVRARNGNLLYSSYSTIQDATTTPSFNGAVKHEQTVTGSSISSSTVTSGSLTAVTNDLYLAAVSTRNTTSVSSVSGLGLTWNEIRYQCSGRDQTQVSLWKAQGTPTGDGMVTATLGGGTQTSAVIAVSRYSGASTTVPTGTLASANTNGINGACSGGTDNNTATVSTSTTHVKPYIYAAVSLRNGSFTPGSGYTERAEVATGTSSTVAGLAIQDKEVLGIVPTSVTADGTLSGTAKDWAIVAVEIIPKEITPTVATDANFTVAFFADTGTGTNFQNVLNLVANERIDNGVSVASGGEAVDLVIVPGDLSYGDPTDDDTWMRMATSTLGSIPLVMTKGNHEQASDWTNKYGPLVSKYIAETSGMACTGQTGSEAGRNTACTYKGFRFILSDAGEEDSYEDTPGPNTNFIYSNLATSTSIWKACTWHRNQSALTAGTKQNEVGWAPYEECRSQGAIIVNGHEHLYSRTRSLVEMVTQEVRDPGMATTTAVIAPNATFVIVSGAGGNSTDYLVTSKFSLPYWANGVGTAQGNVYGALFVTFNVDGDPKKAKAYYKSTAGTPAIRDSFTITVP